MLLGFRLLDLFNMLDDKGHDLVGLVCVCMFMQETIQHRNLSGQLHEGFLRVSLAFRLFHVEIILLLLV